MGSLRKSLTQLELSAPKSTVCVTGASGFLAGAVVERLLAAGHTVHATCRAPEKEDTIKHLKSLPGAEERLTFFKADLTESGSFDDAIKGCDYVIHTASPVLPSVPDNLVMEKLVTPAVKGTEHILGAVNRTPSVKRVVMTSSVAAICGDPRERGKDHKYTEEDWNTTAMVNCLPYAYSKRLAEEKAWEMAKSQDRWDLVTINPSYIVGPPLTADTAPASIEFFLMVLKGTFSPAGIPLGFGFVDVRDVAAAHTIAMLNPNAQGRYIVSQGNYWISNVISILKELYPQHIKLPAFTLPKWFVWLIAPMSGQRRDSVTHVFGAMSDFDDAKIRKELGFTYIDFKDTMRDTVERLRSTGSLKW